MSDQCAKCGVTAEQDSTLTFHRFPKFGTAEPETLFRLRIWAEFCFPGKKINALFLRHLNSSGRTLCSRHFGEKSFVDNSKTQLNKQAIPLDTEHIVKQLTSKFTAFNQFSSEPRPKSVSVVLENVYKLQDPEILKAPASKNVCRICMATGSKLYHMTDHRLCDMYESLTGSSILPNDKLPQVLCWECVARLRSSLKFKDKARNTQAQLLKMVGQHKHLTVQSTLLYNDFRQTVKSTLVKKYLIDHYDLRVQGECIESEEIKVENQLEAEIVQENTTDKKEVNNELENTTDKQADVNRNEDYNITDDTNADSTKFDFDSDDNDMDPLSEVESDFKTEDFIDVKKENVEVKELNIETDISLAELKRRAEMAAERTNGKRKINLVEAKPNIKKRKIKLVERKPDITKKKVDTIKRNADVIIRRNTNLNTIKRNDNIKKRNSDLSIKKKHTDLRAKKRGRDRFAMNNKTGLSLLDENIDLSTIKRNAELGTVKIKLVRKKRGIVKKKGKKEYVSSKITTKEYIDPEDPLNQFTVKYLNYEDQLEELKKRSESTAYQNAKYKCSVCYNVFRALAPLENHSIRHSEDLGNFACAMCLYRFRTLPKLREHIKSRHTELFTCKECTYTTTYRTRARTHVKNHSGKSYPCPHCDDEFKNPSTYFSHVRIKHPAKYVCEICGHTFLSSKGVYMHKKKSHPNIDDKVTFDGPFCEACSVRFNNQDAYNRHLLLSSVHTDERKFSWLRNDHFYLTKSGPLAFDSWLSVFENPKRFKRKLVLNDGEIGTGLHCEVCEETIVGLANYSKHIKTEHPGHVQRRFRAQPHMCEVCGKIVTSSLALHKLSHSEEKQQCPYCQKAYAFTSNLKRHIMSEHKGLRYPCEICGKELTSAKGRREHISHVHHGQPRPKRVRVRLPSEDAVENKGW